MLSASMTRRTSCLSSRGIAAPAAAQAAVDDLGQLSPSKPRGSLIRWLPETAPKRALSAAVTVAIACILGDLTMPSILALRGATA